MRGISLLHQNITVLLACLGIALGVPPAASVADFERDIRPIFETHCYSCHGLDNQLSEFRLDRKSDALRGGGSGAAAIVPHKSAESLLIRYVTGIDDKTVMPPQGLPRLSEQQIGLLRTWIDAGAEWPGDEAASSGHDEKPDGRNHWAFLPRTQPEPPRIEDSALRERVRNPIDNFVFSRLEKRGWRPNPRAKPHELLRRVYLDLSGLPPTISEQDAFYQNPSREALDAVVDDLLARPDYGERWARHWLDLARFGETNGYERDATKPFVWRYRDYVIRAFNDDKPFDRFVLEQLAGDELPDRSAETLVALGYTRLGPWDDEPADPATDRYDQLDDLVSTTSQVFLGLTLGCARCHNHKFEPLTARDYYRFVAVFNPLERAQNGRRELDLPIGTPAQLAQLARRDAKIEPLQQVVAEIRSQFQVEHLQTGDSKLSREVRDAFLKDRTDQTDRQKELVKEYQRELDEELAMALPAEKRERIATLEGIVCEMRDEVHDLPRGYFLHEPKGEPATTHLLIRGKASAPGPEVTPGIPAVLDASEDALARTASWEGQSTATSVRRLALARWIASADNPLTARVIVNRVWQFHFGQGIVRTPSDFGVMGDPPTHPELLDWLATWFVENGWSLKKLHRLIMTSSTYAMSKEWNNEYGKEDSESRLLWRMPYERLEVEAIRDSMLAVSGRLNREMYGPSMYPFVPEAALEGHSDPGKIWQPFDEQSASRRTIYAFVKRSMIVPMIEVLDFCDTTRTAAQRVNTSVAPQALTLFNGDFVNRQARHLARRLREEAGDEVTRQITLAYRLTLAREASADELDKLTRFHASEMKRLPAGGEQLSREEAAEKALQQVCRVILNLNEFVYAD
ncbi:MAG: PSD1 and planctomycete cytochrome C domain-containing protein [Acidobacteria bacterium]|nr:PSD1 and planctomycete cytochrome C domain-containing protein [Acidobacteriota bacterium]